MADDVRRLPDGSTARLPAHGTRERYQHAHRPCSCERCKAANARYVRERRRARARAKAAGHQLSIWQPVYEGDEL